jgi:hypothetical protein
MRSADEHPERSGTRSDATAAEHPEHWERQVTHIYRDLIVPRLSAGRFGAADTLNTSAEGLINAGKLLTVAAAIEPGDPDTATKLAVEVAQMAKNAIGPLAPHLVVNGIAAVIEDHASTIAAGLSVSNLPAADFEALRRCGSTDAATELELSIARLKHAVTDRQRRKTAEGEIARLKILQVHLETVADPPWEDAIEAAEKVLNIAPPDKPGRPRRKWFKAVEAIVNGAVLVAVDGALLFTGTQIGTANAPAAGGILGSLAIGFNDMTSGIEDLRPKKAPEKE